MAIRLFVALVVVALTLTFTGGATAARDTIDVKIGPQAVLLEDGSVRVSVRIRCEPFGEPFEANISLSQDDQTIWGMTGLPFVPCDDRWHTVTATVTSFDAPFHRGPAYASAFVSRMDPDTSEVRQGQDTRTVRVR